MTPTGASYPASPPSLAPEVLARAIAVARAYDPRARQWPALMAVFRLYRALCVGSLHILGREHNRRGARIVVSNHARASDPFLLTFAIGRFHGLAQVEIFTLPIVGPLLPRAGHIPVIPGRGREALIQAEALLESGETILIYPEGRLSHGGPMTRGRTGAARLALHSGAPLQPVVVHVPAKYCRTINGRFYGRPTVGIWQLGGPAYIGIGPAWQPFTGDVDLEDVAHVRRVTDEIVERLEALVAEVQAAAG